MKRGRFILSVLAAGVSLAVSGASRADHVLEYSVKANYLVRFAAFVEWPASAFATSVAPVTVCVAGRDPFGANLTRAAQGQTAHGRAIVVRSPTAGPCHIVYLGEGDPTAAWARPGTLLVTDARVSSQRGAIHFVVAEDRVRFHIDEQAAGHAGLALSSRLLNLALSVRSR